MVFDFKQVKLGLEEWRKLSNELKRIGSGTKLELVMSIVLVPAQSEEGEEDEDLEEEHIHAPNPEFISGVSELASTLKDKYNNEDVEVDYHSHGDHGELFISAKVDGGNIPTMIRDVINEARGCESCSIHSVDAEVHLDKDVSAIIFGDSYKLTAILPSQDGRRLVIMELTV